MKQHRPSSGFSEAQGRRTAEPPDPGGGRAARALLAAVLLAGCAPAFAPPPPPAPEEIPALEAAVRQNPMDVTVLVSLGAAYRAAGRAEDARGTLERALELRPDDPGAVFYLGLAYEDQQAYDQALAHYGRYIQTSRSAELRDALRRRIPVLEREQLRLAVRQALSQESELAQTRPQPRTVAVFPFVYAGASPDLRPLGRALAEFLVTDLSATDRLTVLERVRVQYLLDEMRLAESGYVDRTTAARSGRLLGAGRVVQGRIVGDDRQVEVSAAVVGVGGDWDGRIAPVTEQDALPQFFDLEKRLVLALFRSLEIELTPAERERINRRPTENLQALLEFGLGLEAHDRGNFLQATEHFERAVALDPGFELARERAGQARELATGTQLNTDRLAVLGTAELEGRAVPPEPPGLDALQGLIPSMGGRNAASEALGREGVGTRRPAIEILIRRP